MTGCYTTWREGRAAALLTVGVLMGTFAASPAAADQKIVTAGQRIQNSLTQAQPGDTVFVREGVYKETLEFERDGRADAPIVLMAWPGEKPIVEASETMLTLNRSYTVVDGLIFDHLNGNSDAMDFSGRELDGVDLRDFDLRGARFDGAILTNVELRGVDLTGASFQGATLYFVDLRETTLEKVNFSDAVITRSYLDGVTWRETVCPTGVLSNSNFGTCRGQLSKL